MSDNHGVLFSELKENPPKRLVMFLGRYDAPMVRFFHVEVRSYLIALVNVLLNKKKKYDDVFDLSTVKEALIKPIRLKKLSTVANIVIGTHNLKFPNASVKRGGVFAQLDHWSALGKTDYPFLSSRTVNPVKEISGSGNAAWAPEIRFLTHTFLFENEQLSIAQCLAQQTGVVWETLLTLGLDKTVAEEVGSIIAKRQIEIDADPVDRLSKQVFFPFEKKGKTDYVIITPVQHTGLMREFRQRIKDDYSYEKGYFPNARFVKVGGSNPINAGPYNAECGGMYQHLYADVPSTKGTNKIEKLLYRMQHRHTIFPYPKQIKLDFTKEKRLREEHKLRVAAKARYTASQHYRRVIKQMVQSHLWQIVQDAVTMSHYVAQQAPDFLQQPRFKEFSKVQKKWLEPRLRKNKKLGATEIQQLTTSVRYILNKCPKYVKEDKEKQPIIKKYDDAFSDDINRYYHATIMNMIKAVS